MRRFLRLAIPIFMVLVLVGYGLVSFLIAVGVTKTEREEQEDHPSNHGLQFVYVEFPSRDGEVTLSGWYIPGLVTRPSIIFVHGIGSKRSGDKAMDLAARLVRRGYNVLMFDLRGHGTSGGDKVSGGYFERQDVLGAYDFLISLDVPPDLVGVIGFSMGAGTSILSLIEEPGIRALVVDSTYADASELLAQETARKTVFPKWLTPIFIPASKLMAKQIYGIDIDELVPEVAVAQLDYPILVIHGTADERIPFDHGERVHRSAHPDSVIWLMPDVDHVDAFLTHPDEYERRVVEYFESRLTFRQ